MKKALRLGFLSLLSLTSLCVVAQNESDVAAFLKASKADANVLITGYTAPLVRGASYGMTNGWYNTAKTHKTLGFDLGVSLSAVITPSSDNYFNPRPQLSSATTFNGTATNPNADAPTFLGPKDVTTYTSTFNANGTNYATTIRGPQGLDVKHYVGMSAVPVPMIQLGIGIIKNTDLKIRYVPNIKKGDSKISMFGLGLMHDIKQYFPGHDLLPFDLSVLAAFNSVKGSTSLVNTEQNGLRPVSTDGAFHYKLNSWVAQAIISKKISVLTGYLGVGYGSVSSTADITGTFNIYEGGTAIPGGLKDPFATKFHNKSAKLTAGLRLKLGPIYFVGDYTVQKYNALTVGFGVAIR